MGGCVLLAADEMDGEMLDGRRVRVNIADSPPPRGGGGGGRGGRGGGGGRGGDGGACNRYAGERSGRYRDWAGRAEGALGLLPLIWESRTRGVGAGRAGAGWAGAASTGRNAGSYHVSITWDHKMPRASVFACRAGWSLVSWAHTWAEFCTWGARPLLT